MSASVDDYFKKLGGASSLVNSPKVTATRSSGGATLTVDNCNWDTTTGKVFATYKVDTSNNVISGSEIIWKGIVTSTTSIGSLTRIAGAADSGSAIDDIVELLPASAWANDLMTGLLVEHNQDGTHGAVTATSVTATTLSSDTVSEKTSAAGVTVDGVLLKDGLVQHTGAVQQIAYTLSSSVATGTTALPLDNTIPQITEGTEFMTCAITPKSATNILVIEVTAMLANTTAVNSLGGALFQDATANALCAAEIREAALDAPMMLSLKHVMVAGTTSSTTFRFRAGISNTNTVTFNGSAGTVRYGTAPKSSIVIREYKA